MANLLLIRDLCERKKMTIRELAQRIGRDESSIQSAIRRGSTSSATLELIAKELNVSAGVFFDNYVSCDSSDLIRENAHLKELIKEKERTIEILISDRKELNSSKVGTMSAQ